MLPNLTSEIPLVTSNMINAKAARVKGITWFQTDRLCETNLFIPVFNEGVRHNCVGVLKTVILLLVKRINQ